MTNLVTFEHAKIRKIWHDEQWHFSVIDIVAALTDQSNYQVARKYWNKLAERLKKEGSEVVTNCHRLKLELKISVILSTILVSAFTNLKS